MGFNSGFKGLMTLSHVSNYVWSNARKICVWWNEENVEGNDRWTSWDAVRTFLWSDDGNHEKLRWQFWDLQEWNRGDNQYDVCSSNLTELQICAQWPMASWTKTT